MNCHYSAQGDYKCAKPKQPTKPAATTKAPAKFTNVYFADPELEGDRDFGSDGEERFTDQPEFGCENGECFGNGDNDFGSEENPTYEDFASTNVNIPPATFKPVVTAAPTKAPTAAPAKAPTAAPAKTPIPIARQVAAERPAAAPARNPR